MLLNPTPRRVISLPKSINRLRLTTQNLKHMRVSKCKIYLTNVKAAFKTGMLSRVLVEAPAVMIRRHVTFYERNVLKLGIRAN